MNINVISKYDVIVKIQNAIENFKIQMKYWKYLCKFSCKFPDLV